MIHLRVQHSVSDSDTHASVTTLHAYVVLTFPFLYMSHFIIHSSHFVSHESYQASFFHSAFLHCTMDPVSSSSATHFSCIVPVADISLRIYSCNFIVLFCNFLIVHPSVTRGGVRRDPVGHGVSEGAWKGREACALPAVFGQCKVGRSVGEETYMVPRIVCLFLTSNSSAFRHSSPTRCLSAELGDSHGCIQR